MRVFLIVGLFVVCRAASIAPKTGTANCPNLKCSHHGVLLPNCTCKCQPSRGGPTCDKRICPVKEKDECGTSIPKSECDKGTDVYYQCPYMCGECSEQERPKCTAESNCHKSPQGCEYMGKQHTPAQCANYGDNGNDHAICTNHKGGFICDHCKQYANTPTDVCPYMCGLCKSKCADLKCKNGGHLNQSSCKCVCRHGYSGKTCANEKCPGNMTMCLNQGKIDLKTCKSCVCPYLYRGDRCERRYCPAKEKFGCKQADGTGYQKAHCNLTEDVRFFCPYLCGLCKNTEKPECHEDELCHESKEGCFHMGKYHSPEKCKTYGKHGDNAKECTGALKDGSGWHCGKCDDYANLGKVLCPEMCGICPPKPKDKN